MLGFIQARLQTVHDFVDRVPAAFALPALDGSLTAGDELGLRTTPGRGSDDCLLDELGQRFAITQHRLDFGSDPGLNADGGGGWRSAWF